MKICCSLFNSSIIIREGQISSLIIENQNLLRMFVQSMRQQIEGFDGDITLYIDDKPVAPEKNIELLSEFAPFDINRKTLLNKVLSALEKGALDENNFFQTQKLLADIENFIDELAFELDCELMYEKISINSLLKSLGISLLNDYDNPLERIIDYMQLVRRFEKDKLFIMLNMRSFFDDENMEIFADTVRLNNFKILLLDSFEHRKLKDEQRLIIDADLCEI